DGDPLSVANCQSYASFADFRSIPIGESKYELVRIGSFCCLDDLFLACPRLAIGYVVAYASGEQDRVLNDESNVLSQVGQFQHVDGIAVDPDGSRVRLVEAQQEVDNGRFSGAAGTDYCDCLTGVDRQAEIVQDGLVPFVLE